MAKSTYYYELSKTDAAQERNAPKESEIQVIFTQHKGRYGVRRVYAALANRDFAVNHKRVQRIMDLKNFMIPLLFFSAAVAEYIDYYNNDRIQRKTKWMPPVEFREASMKFTY